MSYTSSKDPKSSMRFVVILLGVVASVILLCEGLYILIHAIKGNQGLDWSGMGVFAGAVLAGYSPILFAKAQQKRFESKKEDNG